MVVASLYGLVPTGGFDLPSPHIIFGPRLVMNSTLTTQRLFPYIRPFFFLSYPTDPPKNIDSFFDASYYTTGRQDLCIIVTCIAVMAILRDALRLGVFEPFARWKLSRDLVRRKRREAAMKNQSNGRANGVPSPVNSDPRPTPKELRQVHRSVLRFAEQGWSVVYYTFQWSFGLVRFSSSFMIFFDQG